MVSARLIATRAHLTLAERSVLCEDENGSELFAVRPHPSGVVDKEFYIGFISCIEEDGTTISKPGIVDEVPLLKRRVLPSEVIQRLCVPLQGAVFDTGPLSSDDGTDDQACD